MGKTYLGLSSHVCKCFLAARVATGVRLFTCMSAYMYGQSTTLYELLIAIFFGIMVGTFVGVYSSMAREIAVAIKTLLGQQVNLGRSELHLE